MRELYKYKFSSSMDEKGEVTYHIEKLKKYNFNSKSNNDTVKYITKK